MLPFAFHSHGSFLRLPRQQAGLPFAIAGLPWDGATTNRPGARMGPAAIREASLMLCDGIHPLFDTTPCGQTTDLGDLMLPNTGLADMRAALEAQAPALIRRHHMAWLGGDHAVTLSLLRAYRAHHGQPLGLLHFDAHCDTWPDHFGERSGHGTWLREAMDEGLVRGEAVVQFGIRSAAGREARDHVREQGGMVFDGRSLRGMASPAQLAPVLQAAQARLAAAGSPPVYLSLDIDCLDPSCAPGTGTPEPGGLMSAQLLTLLEGLVPALRPVGMDCVEVAPPYDHAQLSSYAAAQLVWTYLCARIAAGSPPG